MTGPKTVSDTFVARVQAGQARRHRLALVVSGGLLGVLVACLGLILWRVFG